MKALIVIRDSVQNMYIIIHFRATVYVEPYRYGMKLFMIKVALLHVGFVLGCCKDT